MSMSFAIPGLVVLTLLSGSSVVSAADDPEHGAVLAKRWCSECHVVTADQVHAAADAPSFFVMTGDRARTASGLADFLLLPGTTHSAMPDLHLSRVEIADIVAYVVTLSK